MQDRHDPGLAHDLHVLSRRRALRLAGVAGVSVLVAACSTSTDKKATGTTTTSTAKSTDASGGSFTSVFPACETDRWPHINVEVFGSPGSAVAGENARLTSQIALPEDACKKVYDYDKGYGDSAKNIANMKLDSDSVFGDGSDALATVSGDPDSALLVTMTIGVGAKSTGPPPG